MTIFRTRGFDSLIGKGTVIAGDICIAPDSTFQVDGSVNANFIEHSDEGMGDVAGMGHRIAPKTTLHVNGEVLPLKADTRVKVHNVIITGTLKCSVLHVEGTLAVKKGATVDVEKIFYRDLVIETGAIVSGQMFHLDHHVPADSAE